MVFFAQLLSEDLGFSYHLVEVPSGIYGEKQKDGSWNGMMGEVISGVIMLRIFSCDQPVVNV